MMNNNKKCDNCGREEVNFHDTSNINGKVTEKHLCSECAAKLGYADDMCIDTDRDNWMSAKEAVEYGICDSVIENHDTGDKKDKK